MYTKRPNDNKKQAKPHKIPILCRFYLIGCPKKICKYVHSIDELKSFHLKPLMCPHSDSCLDDKTNSTSGVPCIFYHPHELLHYKPSQKELVQQMINYVKPFTKQQVWKNSRLCSDQLECQKRDCMWAHHPDELVHPKCVYGKDCQGLMCPFYHKEYKNIPWSDIDDKVDFSLPLILPYCQGDDD